MHSLWIVKITYTAELTLGLQMLQNPITRCHLREGLLSEMYDH